MAAGAQRVPGPSVPAPALAQPGASRWNCPVLPLDPGGATRGSWGVFGVSPTPGTSNPAESRASVARVESSCPGWCWSSAGPQDSPVTSCSQSCFSLNKNLPRPSVSCALPPFLGMGTLPGGTWVSPARAGTPHWARAKLSVLMVPARALLQGELPGEAWDPDPTISVPS